MVRWSLPSPRRSRAAALPHRSSGPASCATSFIAYDDRRRDQERRQAVAAMLASMEDPEEREAYLRIVRGQPTGPRTA